MLKLLVLASLWLTALVPAIGAEYTDAVRTLKSAYQDVRWQERSVLKADFTCQAHKNVAILGTQGSRLMVAIFTKGLTTKPVILDIDSALVAAQTTLSVETQDFDMGTGEPGDVGPLPGFKRSRTCKGLKLDDDRIDSVHIYWNRIEGRFQTWQR